MYSRFRDLSHIYIEEAASDHPVTERVLSRLSKSKVISIENYKEILNRNQQSFLVQKQSQKLILAKRNDEFLYPGSDIAPDFGHQHFYYNTIVLNCLYNCEYCYLQGMFPGGQVVAFVNNEDFMHAADKVLKEKGSLYLCLSYETDLLAMEDLLGFTREWIEFARIRPRDWFRVRKGRADWHRVARGLDYSMRLGEIHAPTLVACGRFDPQFPPVCSEQLAQRIPRARVEFFEHSGHYPFLEENEAFWSTVADFFLEGG